jgi:hypothetical protein
MKTIRTYLSRNDIKTLARHFDVADFTVQRALAGYPSELCKNIRAYALNMIVAKWHQFQQDLPEFQKEFEQTQGSK